jgi:carboxyl-terminal processing protease
MLSYLVPKWQNVAVVKYLGYNENIASKGYEGVSLSNYKVIILQNSGTASASEIMIWTIKDYFPNAVTIGENSFGKGSVQTLKEYTDGSSLKYTIAKWFTGKSQTWIDGVWINPDVILELDADAYRKDWTDNQLQRAINY